MATPPGLSEAQFARATARFASAVGAEWVFTSDEDVDLYRDAYTPLWDQPDERRASAAVAPASVEEVQAVMRIANELRIPIYPFSTGRNLGYGGSAPNFSGSVVLDLKRMNRILDVDEVGHSVLVEPGVSYFDLYKHLQDTKSRLWMDCPDPGWGSLIGNALDRGGGYTMAHLRNHFDAHCGMEVVLADGDVVRTGMGALPGARSWQQYKTGCGPWVDGIFSQSNLGVVTKMGFWMLPEPEGYLRATAYAPRYADLHRVVEILNYCENVKLFTGMPGLGSPLLGGGPGAPPSQERAALAAAARLGYSPELESWGLANGVPYWSMSVDFYGPPEVVEAQWRAVKRRFSVIEGATFDDGEVTPLPLKPEQIETADLPRFGIPSLRMFSIGARSPANPGGTHGHIWFSPIIPRTGQAIIDANALFQEAARDLGLQTLGGFTLPTCYWERSFIFLFGVFITRDPEIDARNLAGLKELVRRAGAKGWGEYRTAPVLQDAVMAEYSFNDHALTRLHEKIKDAVDPNGILSAGRYGVWPKQLRAERK